jgi:glycosyltransferase involved in cell wall biosynthesis
MDNTPKLFDNVSLLITHYNRSTSLERLLKTFKEQEIYFSEIIVSDDSSQPIHLDHIKSLHEFYDFRLVSTPVNKGLGNNINKGQLAVKTPFTLYVQEDFIPLPEFYPHFRDSLDIMDAEPDMDIIRFYAYGPYPYLKPYGKGFSEMVYKPWFMDKNKVYFYSDHPHLRRNTFFERFGQYREGLKVDRTEYSMCVAFLKNKGRGLFYNEFSTLFLQANSAEEPSTVKRSDWRQSGNPLIAFVRLLYRQIKYNYDIHFNSKYNK